MRVRSADWNYGGSKWKLSRSKIDLFMECPRCFWLDNRRGVSRPKGPSFTLNVAVDHLLKKEFDTHRVEGTRHPLMEKYGIDAVPFAHEEMDQWRENFVGVQYRHPGTGFLVTGAVDDIWKGENGELIVVDYKATSKDGKIVTMDDISWQRQYRRQMDIYQWLLRMKGFKVSDVGYFVYVNGRKDAEAFDGRLEFDVTLVPSLGDDSWIEKVLADAKTCLDSDTVPHAGDGCEHCAYRAAAAKAEGALVAAIKKSSKKPKENIQYEKPHDATDHLF